MSDIDEIISDIFNINSQNEAERNEATANLTSRILVPQFLGTLIELIVDSNIQSDQNLFIKTLIVLKACLKYNYLKCEVTDENFLKEIPKTQIQLLNSIPPQFHPYIIDYFRQINKIVYRRSPYDTNEEFLNSYQVSTIPILIEQIKEQSNFVSNLYILRLFIKLYIKEEEENRNNEFFSQILNEILPIFVTVLNTEEINEITAESILVISQIMIKLIDENIILLKQFFTSQDIIKMITNYTNFFNSNFEFSKSLNQNLLKLNKRILVIYEDDYELTSFMIPYLFELTTKLLTEMDSNSWDIQTRNISLKILVYYYHNGFFEDEINSEDFLTSILIPSTKLTEEDLNDLSSMPSLISSFFLSKNELLNNNSNYILSDLNYAPRLNNLNFDDSNKSTDLTVRPACRSLANEILKIPELRLFVTQQTEDPIEFESHIFLLSCVDSISNLVPADEIQFILESAISNFDSNPPFIQASYIYYLINHINLISDCSTLVELGVYCINNSDDPLVITASVDLLKNNRLSFKDLENIEEKISIVPKILSFCDAFCFWEPIDVVIKLVKDECNEMNQEFPDFLKELISTLFENCLSIASRPNIERNEFDDFDDFESVNDNFELKKILDKIVIIIKDLDITDELTSFCLQNCLIIMKEIQRESFYFELFCFVSFFNYLLRDPIDDQFDFIMLSISFNNDIAKYVLNAAYPLILNPQSNIESREEFVSSISEICQTFIKILIESEMHQISDLTIDINSLLRVCGALIEAFGSSFVNFVEFAFFIFDSDILDYENHQDYFSHLIYVLYNALMVDPSIVISNLNEKTINYLLRLSINEIACNLSSNGYGPYYRGEVKRHFCLLLEIARIGKIEGIENELLVNYADKCFEKTLVISKSFLYATDYNQQYENLGFNSFLAARYFPTSIDQVDEWKLFFEVVEGAGFQLSDYQMKIIGQIIHAMEENQNTKDFKDTDELI